MGFYLISSVALFLIYVSSTQLSVSTFAQQDSSVSSSTEAVTSTNDAMIKSILIISQVSVLGITFNHVFFQKVSSEKKFNPLNPKNKNHVTYYGNNRYLKRFSILLLSCCICTMFASTVIILLQAYELAHELTLDISSTFSILSSTSVGQVWIMRIITSSIIIGLVTFYYLLERRIAMRSAENLPPQSLHKVNMRKTIPFAFLIPIVIVSSINLFSNSMISHSNALPTFSSLAISIDWIHFAAVSIWIGGLFYFSTLILTGKKLSPEDFEKRDIKTNDENGILLEDIRKTYYMSILLTYFSYIAIVSLGIIGITGLYMGLIHLQSINAIFNTSYGNILIIKLSLAFPMVFMGRYNQLKIQRYVSLAKKIIKNDYVCNEDKFSDLTKQNEKKLVFFKQINRSIKVESLLGISVLIAASFLSVTSPPSLATMDQNSNLVGNSNTANYSSNNGINPYFIALIAILSIIILVLSIVNFRKNHKKVHEIFEQI